ncbi:Scr1 family TA system antitoxin-like transcriptional regulator [Saccharopolyspora spinosa]|uniref:Scr1 family TA system antitoxin-like transcriptional regulator n=1 Tax=Saccharopolyspora spinosa TaxID=60894 RepID=UPI00117AD1A7|nr:Scr1 family TA system antitoxin-like transcriptional regulator [Saccharopolyspora spinosa]
MMVPGLLQTSDYFRAIAEADGLSNPEIERRVMLRLVRREVLTKRNPVQYDVLIGEAALLQPVAPHDVMVDQLRYLIKIVSESPNITL